MSIGAKYLPKRFTIPKNAKYTILDQLNKVGINHSILFPDLNGFRRFVEWKLLNQFKP